MINIKDLIRVNIPEHVSILCRPCYEEEYWETISRIAIAIDWYNTTNIPLKECLRYKGMNIINRETPENECGGEHLYTINVTTNKIEFIKEC